MPKPKIDGGLISTRAAFDKVERGLLFVLGAVTASDLDRAGIAAASASLSAFRLHQTTQDRRCC